jgi:hypothetical protein
MILPTQARIEINYTDNNILDAPSRRLEVVILETRGEEENIAFLDWFCCTLLGEAPLPEIAAGFNFFLCRTKIKMVRDKFIRTAPPHMFL